MRWRRNRGAGLAESVAPAEAPAAGPSRATEFFFRNDGADPGRVVVVHHLEKTAGTSLREMVRENLPASELERGPDLLSLRYVPDEALRWYREWYGSLDEERRSRLCCVMSHTGGYLVPWLDRPVEALVLVREPVGRVLSFYFHKRRNALRRRGPEASFNLLERVYETLGRDRPPNAWRQFFNWQSRSLLSLFHDVSDFPISAEPSPDADLLRARLRTIVDEVFFVGVQDRFEQYVALLGRRYGWSAIVRHHKANPHPADAHVVSPEMIETIRAYNWLDAELYDLCREAQERREAELATAVAQGQRLAG